MSPVPNSTEGARIYNLDQAHVFNSWAVQGAWDPIVIERAQGATLWDYDGKEYLDFCSQQVFTNVGYQHPKLVAAIAQQAAEMSVMGVNFANRARSEAAAALTSLFPDSHQKVFFTNGGADANENAIRMARLVTGRRKVLSLYRSYHGNTGAAIVATGDQRRWPNEYADGHAHFFGPYLYRSPFSATTDEEECERALAHLRQVIELEGPPTIAAILLESVMGAGGVIVPPAGYFAGVRALCDEFGIVFIADEVMSGFGRTGRMFGYELDLDDGATPDLITMAKGINSGYAPLGAVAISNQIAEYFDDKFYPGGLTYSGHPLACASVSANLAILQSEGLVENADRIGAEVLAPDLADLAAASDLVGDVRGVGLFWALELVRDKSTREPLAPYGASSPEMAAILGEITTAGLLVLAIGNRLHLSPPLTITRDQARSAVNILATVLSS